MEKINNCALRILGRREFSVFELKEKLNKKFPDQKECIDTLLISFKEKDWVSDIRFSEVFIKDQIIKKQGPRKIEMKLFKKGITSELMTESLNKFYPENKQIPIAQYLGLRKKDEILRRKPKIADFELDGKVNQFLIGRGFGYDVIGKLEL